MSSPEVTTQKPAIFSFSQEGYLSLGEVALLDKFEQELIGHGFEPNNLVFSGFNGTAIKKAKAGPNLPYVYAMNGAAWREALRNGEQTPAHYAEAAAGRQGEPCIGLYDIHNLREVDSDELAEGHTFDDALNDGIQLGHIVAGSQLQDIPPSVPVSGAVVAVGYPVGYATDSLAGLVFLSP